MDYPVQYLRNLESAVNFPNRVWGGSPVANAFGASRRAKKRLKLWKGKNIPLPRYFFYLERPGIDAVAMVEVARLINWIYVLHRMETDGRLTDLAIISNRLIACRCM